MNPNSENILSREIIHHSQELAHQAWLVYGDQYPLNLLGFYQGDTLFSIYEASPSLSRKKMSQYAFKQLGLAQPDFGTRAMVSVESADEKIILYAHNDSERPPSSYVIDLYKPASIDLAVDNTERKSILEDLPYRYMETSIDNITYGSSELAQHGEPILSVIERDSIYSSTLECTRQIFGRDPGLGESLKISYELADRSIYSISHEINLIKNPLDSGSFIKEPRLRLTFTEVPDSNNCVPRSVALNITKMLDGVHLKSFIYDQTLSIPTVNITEPGSVRELSAVTARLSSSLKYSLHQPTETGLTNSIVRPAGVDFSVGEFIERQLNSN